jgi:hypothetical protein
MQSIFALVEYCLGISMEGMKNTASISVKEVGREGEFLTLGLSDMKQYSALSTATIVSKLIIIIIIIIIIMFYK